jgi:hypothetical protein
MAVATVVSKPSGFRPVATGELNYVFSQATRPTGYHIEIELNGLSVPKGYFYADSAGVITCNIAAMLRPNLLMSPTIAERFKSTYVKYQEVWDAGSNVQVALSGDVIEYYAGSDNYKNHRTRFYLDSTNSYPDNYLSYLISTRQQSGAFPLTTLSAWDNRTSYIDFLHDASMEASFTYLEFQAAGTHSIEFGRFAGNAVGLESLPIKRTWMRPEIKKLVNLTSRTNENIWSTATTKALALYFGSADLGQGYAMKFRALQSGTFNSFKLRVKKVGNPTYTITFKILATAAGLPDEATVIGAQAVINLDDVNTLSDDLVLFSMSGNLTSGTDYALLIQPNNDGLGDANNYYQFYSSTVSTVANANVCNKAAGVWTNDVNKDLSGSVYYSATSSASIYSQLYILVREECANPLYLKWLNDFGGLSTFLFDGDQRYNIDPTQTDMGAYPLMGVVARNLTLEEWEALQELNKPGAEYGDNKKVGAYVVDFTDESNPVNVYVVPNLAETQTKFRKNQAEFTLRYPLIETSSI